MPILKIKDSNNNWVGVPVAKGDTGENAYIWIKYSATQPTADSDMTDTPSPWIGLYSGTSDSAPSHYTDYTWYKFKGEQGEQGEPGETGATPDFSIGTVTTGAAGSSASASITGTAEHPVLNLTIPRGNTGEVTEAQLYALLPTDTASGAVASFPDGADDVPMESLSVALEPIQDLHGYDHPWVGGAGKNILDPDNVEVGWFSATGTGITYNAAYRTISIPNLKAGTYTMSVWWNDTARLLRKYSDGSIIAISADNNNYTFTTTTDGLFMLCFRNTSSTEITTTPNISVVSGSSVPAAFEPYANLCPISGRSSVTAVRDGKNLANIASIKHGDGSARAGNEIISLPAGTYTMSANNVGDCSMTIQFWSSSNNMGTKSFDVGQNSNTITATDDIVRLYCYISTENYNNGKYAELTTIQIETGSSPTAYAPYNGNTYTIQLGQTVYGCTVDLVSGVMTVDRAIVDLGDLYWYRQIAGHFMYSSSIANKIAPPASNDTAIDAKCTALNVVSSNAVDVTSGALIGVVTNGNIRARFDGFPTTNDEFKTAVSGWMFCYPLATPITYQLSETEITTLLGENTVWSDSGDVAVTYKANIQKYIDKKIAEL